MHRSAVSRPRFGGWTSLGDSDVGPAAPRRRVRHVLPHIAAVTVLLAGVLSLVVVPLYTLHPSPCNAATSLGPYEQAVCRPSRPGSVSVDIDPPFGTASYLFSEQPPLLPNPIHVDRVSRVTVSRDRPAGVFTAVLVHGSKVAFNVSASAPVSLLVVDSRHFPPKNSTPHTSVWESHGGGGAAGVVRGSFVAARDDIFYFYAAYGGDGPTGSGVVGVNWTLSLDLMQFNFSAGTLGFCVGIKECEFGTVTETSWVVSAVTKSNDSRGFVELAMRTRVSKSHATKVIVPSYIGVIAVMLAAAYALLLLWRKRQLAAPGGPVPLTSVAPELDVAPGLVQPGIPFAPFPHQECSKTD